MRNLNFCQLSLGLVTMVCLTTCLLLSSCGSTWNIEGNNVTIHKAENDTIIPKGTLFITNDSLK